MRSDKIVLQRRAVKLKRDPTFLQLKASTLTCLCKARPLRLWPLRSLSGSCRPKPCSYGAERTWLRAGTAETWMSRGTLVPAPGPAKLQAKQQLCCQPCRHWSPHHRHRLPHHHHRCRLRHRHHRRPPCHRRPHPRRRRPRRRRPRRRRPRRRPCRRRQFTKPWIPPATSAKAITSRST